MKRGLVIALLAILACLCFSKPANSQDREFDMAIERTKDDKIRGPATIKLKNLNVLRYDIQVGTTVTFTAGPDLKLPFIPPIPKPAASGTVTGQSFGSDPISARFEGIVNDLVSVTTEMEQQIFDPINAVILAANGAKDELEALLLSSDSILRTPNGPATIISGIDPVLTRINAALATFWPNVPIESFHGRLEMVRVAFLDLPSTPVGAGQLTWQQWYVGNRKAAYDTSLARIGEFQALLRTLDVDGPKAIAYRETQNKLRQWRPILVGVRNGGPEAFTRTIEVGCGFAFDQTKSTKVEIIKRDRLAAPGASETHEEVVTVECTSPLSISGGFGFSSIDEMEFVFVQSKPDAASTSQAPVNRFGFKNRSSFRMLPVLLLNTRLWESDDTFAVHASVGAAVDIKTGQTGTDIEFIVGPSLSFKRTLFITPGLHVGRVPTLTGGFNLGDVVPTGVSSPPVEKAWRKGFVITFTFKIR
jgi:hypothetical protein